MYRFFILLMLKENGQITVDYFAKDNCRQNSPLLSMREYSTMEFYEGVIEKTPVHNMKFIDARKLRLNPNSYES